ncbi:MAG: hypothetical protein V7637_238 [Mycobacteriales bacterium]
MKVRRAVVVVGVACATLGTGGVGNAAAPAGVRCGVTITNSTTLEHDLNCRATAPVRISGHGVTLDLGGHALAGAVYLTGSHQTVRGGSVTSLSISDADNVDLADLRLTGSLFAGWSAAVRLTRLEVDGGDVGMEKAANVDVVDSLFRNGMLGLGVVSGVRVERNRFVNSRVILDGDPEWSFEVLIADNLLQRSGIEMGSTDGVVVQRNHIIGANVGVRIGDASDGYQVIDNNIVGGGFGIRIGLGSSGGNLVSGNWLRANGIAGLLVTGQPGHGSGLRITHNLAHANGYHPGGARDAAGRPIDDGIHIGLPPGDTAGGVVVDHNRTSDNADRGIDAEPGSVHDGGGNFSERDGAGCVGVRCG